VTTEPYRRVLALPGVRGLTLLALLVRIPITATGVVLTLHVVLTLEHGYGAAGLVGGAATVASALGAPWLGRMVDQHGLRRMLSVSIVAEAVFWFSAPWLPYPVLLVSALVSGLFTLPVFSVVRQSLAALVPEDQRRPAYSLDSMSIELSYMLGPLLGVLLATQVSTTVAMLTLGATIVASGVALFAFNPPVKGDSDVAGTNRPSWRSWLRPRLASVLIMTTGAALVLAGTDLAIVGALQSSGQVSWIGLVVAVWCAASLVGGFVYGVLPRAVPVSRLTALLGLLTVPVGLGTSWWALCLLLIPAGLLCAPTLAAGVDAVSKLAPEAVRGLVMGLHSSALTAGLAIGAPLAGFVIDVSSPPWAFVVAGSAGVAVTGLAWWVGRAGFGDQHHHHDYRCRAPCQNPRQLVDRPGSVQEGPVPKGPVPAGQEARSAATSSAIS
jgi:MFS family permease